VPVLRQLAIQCLLLLPRLRQGLVDLALDIWRWPSCAGAEIDEGVVAEI